MSLRQAHWSVLISLIVKTPARSHTCSKLVFNLAVHVALPEFTAERRRSGCRKAAPVLAAAMGQTDGPTTGQCQQVTYTHTHTHTHTHTRLTALFPGLPWWAGIRKVEPIWILLKQETVNGSGISWAICKSAPCSRQTTTPAPHHSVFYRPDALSAAQPTASKHWRYSSSAVNKWQHDKPLCRNGKDSAEVVQSNAVGVFCIAVLGRSHGVWLVTTTWMHRPTSTEPHHYNVPLDSSSSQFLQTVVCIGAVTLWDPCDPLEISFTVQQLIFLSHPVV